MIIRPKKSKHTIEHLHLGGQFNMDLIENKPYVGVHVRKRRIDRFNQQKSNKQKRGRKRSKLQKMNQIANTNLYFFRTRV